MEYGGDSNESSVVRAGSTVVRPAGYWTPAVHALLNHLQAEGFTGAPRVVSHGGGRETLTFLSGETAGPEFVAPWSSDERLVSVGALIRRYHNAVASFVAPGWARWQPTSVPTIGTLVCHNDLYRGNIVFQDGQAAGLIDFDFAHPADPIWDVAVAAWHWVPLSVGRMPTDIPPDRWPQRLRLFVDSYGAPAERRKDVLGTVLAFLRNVRARAGADGRDTTQPDLDLETVQRHEAALAAALR